MKYKTILKALLISTLFISASVFAKTITITCPLADTVQIADGRATGFALITDAEHLVQMGGDTKSNVTASYAGAAFYDGMLGCAYKGDKGGFGIVNYNISGNLYNCHFDNEQAKCKSKDVQACILYCKGSY